MSSFEQSAHPARFWTPYRLAITLVILSSITAFGAASCNSTEEKPAGAGAATEQPRPVISPMTNAPAPAQPVLPTLPASILNAELPASSGAPIKLANYSGKVLIVNLWATWCGPCRIETPELVRLYQEYRSKGVEVVGLSTEDPEASANSVRNFVKDYEVSYRVGWATQEVALALMQGRDAIPQSFVIARDGHIVRRFVGFNASTTPPQIKQAIEEALKAG
jgi:cytochrome c biogenesis protein CcmG/thiol:disulfide interchange protein DsbE